MKLMTLNKNTWIIIVFLLLVNLSSFLYIFTLKRDSQKRVSLEERNKELLILNESIKNRNTKLLFSKDSLRELYSLKLDSVKEIKSNTKKVIKKRDERKRVILDMSNSDLLKYVSKLDSLNNRRQGKDTLLL